MSASRFKVGPRRIVADYWIPNGTHYESHLRQINGTEYRFVKITHTDGSLTLMSDVIGFDQTDYHAWTVTPTGGVF